jgi:translation initiation factor 3 subunit J
VVWGKGGAGGRPSPTARRLLCAALCAALSLTKPQKTTSPQHQHRQPRKAPAAKKYAHKESMGAMPAEDAAALDDPLAERLRRQRLVEESDLRAAQELFGSGGGGAAGAGGSGAGNEQQQMRRRLEQVGLLPKALKEFEEIGQLAAKLHVLPHAGAKHYKALVKSLLRAACEPLSAEDSKEIETAASAVRADKVKADKAAAAARAAKGRRAVNAGGAGGAGGAVGGKSAGLDEYVYNDAGDGDDFDFM